MRGKRSAKPLLWRALSWIASNATSITSSDKTPADVNTLEDVRRFYQQYRSVYERGAAEAGEAEEMAKQG